MGDKPDTRPAEDIAYGIAPLHGPYGQDETLKAVNVADELVRYLNYATATSEALPYPNVIYDLLGTLKTTAAKLPQLLGQTSARLVEQSHDPAFVNRSMDYWAGSDAAAAAHADAVERVDEIRDYLDQAADLAQRLSQRLTAAQNLMSPIGMNFPPAEDGDDE